MNKLEKYAFYTIIVTIFLLPVAFLSPAVIPLDILKSTVFTAATALAFVLFLFSNTKKSSFLFLKGKLFYSLYAIVAAYLLSGLFTLKLNGFDKTFIGSGEVTSIIFIVTALIFVYVFINIVNTKEKIVAALSSFLLSSSLLAVFHLLRVFFGPDFLSLGGIFSNQISNTIGLWNDLAAFFGFSLILSYFAIEYMTLEKKIKAVLYGTGIASLFFLTIIGSVSVWYALGIVSLISIFYSWKHKKLSFISIVILVVAVLSIVFNSSISGKISQKLNINPLDVRPSLELSFDIASQTLKESPIFGAGPNHFTNQYLKYKPLAVNQTIFWALDFNSGISTLMTIPIVLGILGLVTLGVFIVILFIYFFKAYTNNPNENIDKFILNTGMSMTVYSLVLAALYNPSLPIAFLGLLSFSVFVFGLHSQGILSYGHFEINTKIKKNVFTGFLVVLIGFGIVLFVFSVRRGVSSFYFQKALVTANTSGDTESSKKYIEQAIAMSKKDSYYVALAELYIRDIQVLLSSTKKPDEQSVNNLKNYLEKSVSAAQTAVRLDPQNYQNYISLARVYESVVPAQVNGAYDNAMQAYAKASSLNPYNPAIFLAGAQLEFSMKKNAEAKKFIGLALQAKNNYNDAIFLLSQIQVSENSIKDAITSLTVLAQLNPNDPTIFFQLGLLYYNSNDNVNTVLAMNRAIALSPQYSNARYFLGLALARLGKYSEAAKEIEEVAKLNPDNTDVANILNSLRSGRSPFQSAAKPEKSKKLPVKDSIDKKVSSEIQTR